MAFYMRGGVGIREGRGGDNGRGRMEGRDGDKITTVSRVQNLD